MLYARQSINGSRTPAPYFLLYDTRDFFRSTFQEHRSLESPGTNRLATFVSLFIFLGLENASRNTLTHTHSHCFSHSLGLLSPQPHCTASHPHSPPPPIFVFFSSWAEFDRGFTSDSGLDKLKEIQAKARDEELSPTPGGYTDVHEIVGPKRDVTNQVSRHYSKKSQQHGRFTLLDYVTSTRKACV